MNATIQNPSFEDFEQREARDCAFALGGSCNTIKVSQSYPELWNRSKFTFEGSDSAMNYFKVEPNRNGEITQFGLTHLEVFHQTGYFQDTENACGVNYTDFFENSVYSCIDTTATNFTGFSGFAEIEDQVMFSKDIKIRWYARKCDDIPTKPDFGFLDETYGVGSNLGRYKATIDVSGTTSASPL